MTTLFMEVAGEVTPITGIPINPNTINPTGNAFIFSSPFLSNKKAESPVHFGNPAIFSICRLFRYSSSVNDLAKILTQLSSHSQAPHLGFKDPWLSVPPSRMVWLWRQPPF
jgi:hypothetical protein